MQPLEGADVRAIPIPGPEEGRLESEEDFQLPLGEAAVLPSETGVRVLD